jgi:tetratricopeptide (TPR) repeat protein
MKNLCQCAVPAANRQRCDVRAVLILALTITATACAARTIPPSSPPQAFDDAADRLIRQGCYRCLEQAYEGAQSRGARMQAFEAAALLTLRSKELGLPSEMWLERARDLAGADTTLSLYLEVVDAIPPDRLSENREALFDVRRRNRVRGSFEMWRERLRDGSASDAFRGYLEVSLICAFGTLKETPDSFSDAPEPVTLTPLFQYALGNCDATLGPRLSALRTADPDFVDADYPLGRYALEDPVNPDAEESLERFESASRAFPRSPAITTRIGNLYRLWEDWTPALVAFDAALAVAPNHPEATIGRAVSLSQLERSEEAIETATRLIDGGQWLLGEAYYWRAWNHLRLNNFQLARADADRARTLMSNAAVLVLSGVIEWRLGRLESAEKDFEGALAIDLGECEAAFNLGVVRDQLKKLPEALAAFKQAGQCYDLSIVLRREAIDKIRKGNGTDTFKARDSARHERVLAELAERRSEIARVVDAIEKPDRPPAVP